MSEQPQAPGSGLQVNAGPVMVEARGSTAVNVLLIIFTVLAALYVVQTTNQQTAMLTAQHNAIMASIAALTQANENLFLSTMLPDGRKKDLPSYIQDRARDIVERKAEKITDDRR